MRGLLCARPHAKNEKIAVSRAALVPALTKAIAQLKLAGEKGVCLCWLCPGELISQRDGVGEVIGAGPQLEWSK